MPRLEYFLLADSLSVDQDTNNVSIFHVLEEVTIPLPGHIPRLVAISSWNIEPEERQRKDEFQATLRIHQPWEEKAPKHKDLPTNFTAERRRHRICQYVTGVPVKEAGELEFEILLNGEHAASHFVTVHGRKQGDE